MAARKLFVEKGYDAATLREIAREAGLGPATLFNHIQDKRDLIYLIFDEDVELMTERALSAPRSWQNFIAKILMVTEPHFRLFAEEPALSRILLSEVLQQAPGPHLERHLRVRGRLIGGIEQIIAAAQAAGELRADTPADVFARSIFFAFSGLARWWIAGSAPDWRGGQQQFEQVLTIMCKGMQADPSQASKAGRSKILSNSRAHLGAL